MTSLPTIVRDDASAPFFDAAASGTLAVRRCANGHYQPPPPGFGGPANRCQVYARTGEPTNVAGIVELAEGPWMNALIDVAPDAQLRAGQALTVCFLPTDGGETIPAFRPA